MNPLVNAFHVLADEWRISGWPRTATCWLWANQITTNPTYRPAHLVTRAEMSAFLYRTGGTLGNWIAVT